MNKIIQYKKLTSFIIKIRQLNNQLVLVGGVFDILHLGHLRFLAQAKKYGALIVALESDASVKRKKGNHRPFHTQEERAQMLTSLICVDYILLLPDFTKDQDYAKLTEMVQPSIVAVTEGDKYLLHKTQQAAGVGAHIIVIPKIHSPSTTQLAKLLELE